MSDVEASTYREPYFSFRHPARGPLARLLAHLLIRLLIVGTWPAHLQAWAALWPLSILGPLIAREAPAGETDSFAHAREGRQVTDLKVGHFSVSWVDLEVPLAGLPIRVTRTYDSRDKGKGDFGVGWRLDLSNVRVQESGTIGFNWAGVVVPGYFPSYCLQPIAPQVVTVTLPDGRVLEFDPVVTPQCQTFVPISEATISFRPRPGTLATLKPVGDGFVWVEGSWPGVMQLFDGSSYDLFDPNDYVLTFPDGRELSLNQAKGLTQIKDLNGNVLTVSPSGITHSSGLGIAIARDTQGRITQITDPESHAMTYGYDARGDLVSFADRETNTTRFGYSFDHPHHLEKIDDPLGRTPIRNEYFPDGRIKSHTDAFGKTIVYTHDLSARQEVVTDREGGVRVLGYDERGNVVREVDPRGKVTKRTFDDRNNRTSETVPHEPADLSPPTTVYTYDAQDDLRSVKDPENNTTEYTYNARKQILVAKDPRGNFTLNAYDAKGNLTSTKVSTSVTGTPALSETSYTYRGDGSVETQTTVVDGGTVTTRYEYDAGGNLTKETDALDHVTSYTYDRSGNRLTQTTTRTTPAGVETLTTVYTYDRQGRLTKTTDPDGSFTETVYNELGRQKETRDKLGRLTKYTYDDMGRLTKTTYPDLTTEESTYSGEGRRLTSKDRAGRVTSYEYDELGRLKKTIHPDTTFTENTYDAAGRLVETKDARGKTTVYGNDGAGRRTSVKVPLTPSVFAETVFTYDPAGNQRTVRDANLHTTTFEHDEHNRRTKTIFPDTTFTETTYDSLGRRVAERDQADRVTQYRYDGLGRLAKVIDARLEETAYGHDELGNRTSQTDANGNTTRFEYDKLGRETARILPDGKRETKTYDAAGRLESRTDFRGWVTSYEYEPGTDRLQRRSHQDGEVVSFTYFPTGRRKTMTDSTGTTTYAYDLRDRLTSITAPSGDRIEYTYDGNGNRLTLTTTVKGVATTTTSTYDDAGRLDLLTDWLGGTNDHEYDPSGNRTSLVHFNGVTTSYGFDDLNRLRSLTTVNAAAATIQGYAFELGPAGNRTRITEADGTARDYGYDELYRLTRETVTRAGVLDYEKLFGYDDVGNRLSQATTRGPAADLASPAALEVDYEYDQRDRLTVEQVLGSTAITYSYDDNGNTTGKNGEATYTWDAQDRLVRVDRVNGTVVTYAYDGDGVRVRTTTTSSGQPAQVVNYLVATSGALSHVLVETDGSGDPVAFYVRSNDELIEILRPDGVGGYVRRAVHADGIGSIRRLTDEAGQVADLYEYEAFGTMLRHVGSDPQPYAFAGEPLDPNVGWQLHRARWMDPRSGRFVSMDEHRGSPFEPITLHRYLYAGVDPVNMVDPSGNEFSLSSALTTVGNIITMAARAVVNVVKILRHVRVMRFFWDSRSFTSISRAYWRVRGPAAGRSLHHWLIPQRWTWVPEGIRNAGFNLMETPAIMIGNLNINSWMGFALRWGGYRWVLAMGIENGIRILIPISLVGGAAAGGAAGNEAVEVLSQEWKPEDMQREALTPGNELGPLPADEEGAADEF